MCLRKNKKNKHHLSLTLFFFLQAISYWKSVSNLVSYDKYIYFLKLHIFKLFVKSWFIKFVCIPPSFSLLLFFLIIFYSYKLNYLVRSLTQLATESVYLIKIELLNRKNTDLHIWGSKINFKDNQSNSISFYIGK